MKKSLKTNLFVSISLFLIFIIYTISVKFIDVKLVGNKLSPVGFASLNEVFFDLNPSINNTCYKISEFLGYFSILTAVFFVLVGVFQFYKTKNPMKINLNIYLLGFFYIGVMAFYLLFEVVVINYRPLMMPDAIELEASYPSSHTLLTLCFLSSALIVIKRIFPKIKNFLYNVIAVLFSLIMIATVVTRLLSGVHWFTDILGGVLLSAALIMSFKSFIEYFND